MKQLKISLIIVVATLLFTSCQKNCIEKPPKDLKPINWDGYNDVYTAFWNSYGTVSDKVYMKGRDIMVYGLIGPTYYESYFTIIAETYDTDTSYPLIGKPCLNIRWSDFTSLDEKLDSCDLTQKCYIKGKLDFNSIEMGICKIAIPEIIIESLDDFYFE